MLFATLGCLETDPLRPGAEPVIVNDVDKFEFELPTVESLSAVWTYDWTTTGTVAMVDQTCALSSGVATVTISDSTGNVVYSGDLSERGSFVSSTGTTGQWQIEVTLAEASGGFHIRAQKNR
jgi:hypothetical protein